MRVLFAALLTACVLSPTALAAKTIYVHIDQGDDAQDGGMKTPFATIQKAVNTAEPGDEVQLLPPGALYRQSVTFANRFKITLEGNGCTLDGSDPLPADGWESLGENLRRRRLPRPRFDRHLLAINGKVQRMGRSPSKNSEFASPQELQPGQFCFENIDDADGWLYVCGPVDRLEWSVRVNGYATGGDGDGLVVRNLNTRRFLNDGFNIHGRVKNLLAQHITGYDCYDEGFSAHDTCTCRIEHGKFWGNDNAIADVNEADTEYYHCEFRDSQSCDVLFQGGKHRLQDCTIENVSSATALAGSPSKPANRFVLELQRVQIRGRRPDGVLSRVRINGGQVTIAACEFRHVAFNTLGAQVKAEEFTLPESQWVKEDEK